MQQANKGKAQVSKHKSESTVAIANAEHRDGATRSSDEACESRQSKGVASLAL